MSLERLKDCKLEEVIGFILRRNQVREFRLILYRVELKSNKQSEQSDGLWER